MQNPALKKYRLLPEALETDEEYQSMEKKYRSSQARLLRVLDELDEAQRTVILEYIGLCAEMDMRATEIACFTL